MSTVFVISFNRYKEVFEDCEQESRPFVSFNTMYEARQFLESVEDFIYNEEEIDYNPLIGLLYDGSDSTLFDNFSFDIENDFTITEVKIK